MMGVISATMLLLVGSLAAPTIAQSRAETIAQAVRPLPEELRDDATVYRYDADTGERIILRQGSNHLECQPRG